MIQCQRSIILAFWQFFFFFFSSGLLANTQVAGATIIEKLNAEIPDGIELTAEDGKTVRFKDILLPGKPAVLAPAYYSCPRLCTYVYDGLAEAIRKSLPGLTPGKDYAIISLSFNPEETAELARKKGDAYRATLPPEARPGWNFYTGKKGPAAILKVAGYGYTKQGEDYAHQAAIIVLSPEGKIMRYLYGIEFAGVDYRFSLMDAGRGKIGSTAQKILLSCFRYDSLQGKYAPYAFGFIRLGSLATLLALIFLIIFLKFRKRS